jgi:hypothetical protein
MEEISASRFAKFWTQALRIEHSNRLCSRKYRSENQHPSPASLASLHPVSRTVVRRGTAIPAIPSGPTSPLLRNASRQRVFQTGRGPTMIRREALRARERAAPARAWPAFQAGLSSLVLQPPQPPPQLSAACADPQALSSPSPGPRTGQGRPPPGWFRLVAIHNKKNSRQECLGECGLRVSMIRVDSDATHWVAVPAQAPPPDPPGEFSGNRNIKLHPSLSHSAHCRPSRAG